MLKKWKEILNVENIMLNLVIKTIKYVILQIISKLKFT